VESCGCGKNFARRGNIASFYRLLVFKWTLERPVCIAPTLERWNDKILDSLQFLTGENQVPIGVVN
jgi:hypothetical protein